jgi:hypothetical protein
MLIWVKRFKINILLIILLAACSRESGELLNENFNNPIYPDRKFEQIFAANLFSPVNSLTAGLYPFEGSQRLKFIFQGGNLYAFDLDQLTVRWVWETNHILNSAFLNTHEIKDYGDNLLIQINRSLAEIDPNTGTIVKWFDNINTLAGGKNVLGWTIGPGQVIYMRTASGFQNTRGELISVMPMSLEVTSLYSFEEIFLGHGNGGIFYDEKINKLVFLFKANNTANRGVALFTFDLSTGEIVVHNELRSLPANAKISDSKPISYQNQKVFFYYNGLVGFNLANKLAFYWPSWENDRHIIGRENIFLVFIQNSREILLIERLLEEPKTYHFQWYHPFIQHMFEHPGQDLLIILTSTTIDIYDYVSQRVLSSTTIKDYGIRFHFFDEKAKLLYIMHADGALRAYTWPL